MSNWLHGVAQQAAQLQERLVQAVGHGKSWKHPKFNMPGMKVDIDMLNPALTTIKTHSSEMWQALPPPLQAAVPFLGTAVVTVLGTRAVFVGRLSSQEAAGEKLRRELGSLQDRFDVLHAQYKGQQALLEAPRAVREVQMAEAVAQASTAAAAAATAAATAAEAAAIVISSKVKGMR